MQISNHITSKFIAFFQYIQLIRHTYEGNSFLYYQYPKLKPEFLQLKLLSVIALLDAGSAIPSRIQPSGRQRRVVLHRRSRNRYCPLLCTATRVSSSSWSYWGGPGECQPRPLPGVKKNMSKRVHGQQRERESGKRERKIEVEKERGDIEGRREGERERKNLNFNDLIWLTSSVSALPSMTSLLWLLMADICLAMGVAWWPLTLCMRAAFSSASSSSNSSCSNSSATIIGTRNRFIPLYTHILTNFEVNKS